MKITLGLFLVLMASNANAAEYIGSQYKDPFRIDESIKMAKKEDLSARSFKLEGYVWKTSKPQAVINGEVVGVGDVVRDAEIISISQEGVKLLSNSKEILLTLDT